MRSPNLQLTVSGDRFSITPLPPQVESLCTSVEHCGKACESSSVVVRRPCTR